MQTPKKYLVYLIDFHFHELNSLFVLSFENNTFRTVHTRQTLHLSSNAFGDCNDETNFHLSCHRQVAKIRKTFNNDSTVYIKLFEIQLSKIMQLGEFLHYLSRDVLTF